MNEQKEFEQEFLTEVLQDLQALLDASLYSKGYKSRLFLNQDEIQKLTEYAKRCVCSNEKSDSDIVEWFTAAFIAGIVHACQCINGITYVRTPVGYERWEKLLGLYATEYIQEKITERRVAFEKARSIDMSLARHLLESPIITIKLPSSKDQEKKAKDLLTEENILKHLCSALTSVSNDVFDIAKVVTPILLSLSLTKVISIPLEPPLFAMIAVIISRMGVSALCGESNSSGRKMS